MHSMDADFAGYPTNEDLDILGTEYRLLVERIQWILDLKTEDYPAEFLRHPYIIYPYCYRSTVSEYASK